MIDRKAIVTIEMTLLVPVSEDIADTEIKQRIADAFRLLIDNGMISGESDIELDSYSVSVRRQ